MLLFIVNNNKPISQLVIKFAKRHNCTVVGNCKFIVILPKSDVYT